MELQEDVYEKIAALSEQGDDCAEKGEFGNAIYAYKKALDLLPLPKTDWEAATWLYVALGDAYFNNKTNEDAMSAYQSALMCPNGTENPYIWFSIGQLYFEEENIQQAKEHFMRAYMLDGADIFEDENPDYYALIKTEVEREPHE